jgi:phage baseplate assembly protein V
MNDNLISQLIRTGKVSSINPANCTAKVVFEDLDNKVSGDLRLLMNKTQDDKDYWLPDIDEMVECLFLPIGMSEGIILGSTYSEADTPPWSDADIRGTKFKDGSFWCYNRKTGFLDIEVVKQINLKAPDFIIESNVKITGKVAVDGSISATDIIKSDSDVSASGISLKQHMHTGNLGSPTSTPIED